MKMTNSRRASRGGLFYGVPENPGRKPFQHSRWQCGRRTELTANCCNLVAAIDAVLLIVALPVDRDALSIGTSELRVRAGTAHCNNKQRDNSVLKWRGGSQNTSTHNSLTIAPNHEDVKSGDAAPSVLTPELRWLVSACLLGKQHCYQLDWLVLGPSLCLHAVGTGPQQSSLCRDRMCTEQHSIGWGGYLDQRGMKWREGGENFIMRNFMICTIRQVLLE
jgi:hypothetical protein